MAAAAPALRFKQHTLHQNYCLALHACIGVAGDEIKPYADTIVALFIRVLECEGSTEAHETVFMALGVLAGGPSPFELSPPSCFVL